MPINGNQLTSDTDDGLMTDATTGALQIAIDATDQADPSNLKAMLLAKGYYLDATSPSNSTGTAFPVTDLYDGRPFLRTDLQERFFYNTTLTKWLGEKTAMNFGKGGNLTQNSYFDTFGVVGTSAASGYPTENLTYIYGVSWSYSAAAATAIVDIYEASGSYVLLGSVDISASLNGSAVLNLQTSGAFPIVLQSRSGNNVIKDSALILSTRRLES